jgi:hypothetical protein
MQRTPILGLFRPPRNEAPAQEIERAPAVAIEADDGQHIGRRRVVGRREVRQRVHRAEQHADFAERRLLKRSSAYAAALVRTAIAAVRAM